MVWQMAQLLIPVYFMIRENAQMVIWSAVFLGCSYLLKKYWWNILED
jgi:solute:Na+ symporter, SSS family